METWLAFSFCLRVWGGRPRPPGAPHLQYLGLPITTCSPPPCAPVLPSLGSAGCTRTFFQTLIRPQHMIERFLFPYWPCAMKELVDPMSRCSLQALQDVNQRERPPVCISQRQEKQVDVIGMTTTAHRWIRAADVGRAPSPASAKIPASLRQCARTRSRARSGRSMRAAVQNVRNRAASAFCKCGSRLRYRYFANVWLVDMQD